MKKLLFIDRDGTLITEPEDEQIDSLQKLQFIPGVFTWLGRIARELDYELIMVTNQDGLGTNSFPEADFWPAHHLLVQTLENEGIRFREILIDRSLPADKAPTRKPETGLVKHYMLGDHDLEHSYVIGDRLSDIQFAENIGCQAIFFSEKEKASAALNTESWEAIYRHLKTHNRTVHIQRNTRETRIDIRLNLDGNGQSSIQTGLPFFDHMLDQLARHGGLDLELKTAGDLQVDEHHTIEDTALALGQAFDQALGKKTGINRYGFLLPMDDALAQVAIDFGGRPWLEWKVDFQREKIGDMPTEMFFHFFKSFCDSARCNLNIQAEGSNEHHKIEAIFKGFAKAIRMAVQASGMEGLPTTKGTL